MRVILADFGVHMLDSDSISGLCICKRHAFLLMAVQDLLTWFDEFFELRYNREEETIVLSSEKITDNKDSNKRCWLYYSCTIIRFQIIRRLPHDNLVQISYRLEDEEFTVRNATEQLLTESGRIELNKDEDKEIVILGDAYTS
ncbi:hypothetical protein CDAR_513301 [Caerostris darwini]|uniref:Uncharacterized protein n=1 Tax=Caerostris darwini TaxID=1538125 RepID=A0AAV4X2B6_9ARAC|nr:hypothetical protein CDAR_513301 [Caerostris darwini]